MKLDVNQFLLTIMKFPFFERESIEYSDYWDYTIWDLIDYQCIEWHSSNMEMYHPIIFIFRKKNTNQRVVISCRYKNEKTILKILSRKKWNDDWFSEIKYSIDCYVANRMLKKANLEWKVDLNSEDFVA